MGIDDKLEHAAEDLKDGRTPQAETAPTLPKPAAPRPHGEVWGLTRDRGNWEPSVSNRTGADK